jgi:HAE1 family hydrophobic/amphiphilic exporter-1
VPGIASVRVRGGRATEVHVDFDVDALAARNITVSQLAQRVRVELSDVSAGDFVMGKRRVVVRSRFKPEQVADLERIIVATSPAGIPIRLSEVATVKVGPGKPLDIAIADGDEAIAILPQREAGFNVLEVTEQLREVIKTLNEEKFAPEGLKIEIVDDQVSYIRGSINVVRDNLILGAVLAILVLLIFLRRFTAATIISLAIPVSVLGTAIGMAALGRTINVVSLAGMTFAIGMVIDNSIVALENIDSWSKKIEDARMAAWTGIKEVAGALLASTATTAAVFIPIIAWQGEVGEILRDLAYAIALSVSISFGVSLLIIPSMAGVLLRNSKNRPLPLQRLAGWGEVFRRGIGSASSWLARKSWRAALVSGIAVGLALLVAVTLLPKMEYLPTGNRNLIFGIILPPPGYSVEESYEAGFKNQQTMLKHTGQDVDGIPNVRRSFFVGDPSQFLAGAATEDPDRIRELRDFMQGLHGQIPGVINFASQAALFAAGIGEGRAVEIELTGPDLNQLVGIGRKLMGESQKVIPGSRVRPVPLLDEGAKELHVVPRRDEVADLGVSSQDLSLVADVYIDGRKIGEWGREGEPKVDVKLRAISDGSAEDSLRLLNDAPVATSRGDVVPFGVLADLETRLGPTVIQRVERKRAVILQVTPPDDVPFEYAIETLQSQVVQPLIDSGELPPMVEIRLGGTAGKLRDAQQQFAWVLVIALIISFLLLAALFEDFLAPIVVLVTIPLAAAGGVLGLLLVDSLVMEQPLDIMTAVGFLILIGVVVNNAILIVDGAIARLRDGDLLDDAVATAVINRVRPIFMSTLTSLAGLLPMTLATGAGSELYRGVGAVLLGGLLLSTLMALFVVPCLFSLVWRLRTAVLSVREMAAAE